MNYLSYLCSMETKAQETATIEVLESIESKYRVDYVESGLPRWLIEEAFVCIVIQAVFNWSPVIDLTDENFFWLRAIINTFGTLVMYIALLRGCRRLYRPFQAWWWVLIVLDVLGFLTMLVAVIDDFCGLHVGGVDCLSDNAYGGLDIALEGEESKKQRFWSGGG